MVFQQKIDSPNTANRLKNWNGAPTLYACEEIQRSREHYPR